MKKFDFEPTTRIVFGYNSLEQLADLVSQIGSSKALVITDKGLVKTGHVEKALSLLRKRSISTQVFADVEENPATRHVYAGVQAANDFSPDILIGLGGGSSMDCAKGINFIYTNGGKMEDYWGIGKAKKPMLPSIGIPTTAGTGSEAQSYALIAQEETHSKMACGDIKARFTSVILDPELAKSAPREVKAVTGMDAISHAVESFVCTRKNAISQMFAKEAWRLLSSNYKRILEEPENTEALGQMLLGANFAGSAIENSMLGAAHACANPLTARYKITHGIAVGLMLPHVVRFNAETVNGGYDTLAIGGAGKLAAQISDFRKINNWPENLRDFGISEGELPVLAKDAVDQWTAKFNPRPLGEKELLELYRLAY